MTAYSVWAWYDWPLIVGLVCAGLGWLFGHRAGVRRERERSTKRAVQMMETRNLIRAKAR